MQTGNNPAALNRCRGSTRAERQTHQEERNSAELRLLTQKSDWISGLPAAGRQEAETLIPSLRIS